jgi:hypothetical protein
LALPAGRHLQNNGQNNQHCAQTDNPLLQ